MAASLLQLGATAYAGIGVAFALAFAAKGVAVVDPSARGAPLGFRLLLIPGAVAFWPLLGFRWWRT